MNQFRWGWNVNGQRIGDESYFLNHVQTMRPAWMLIMSNIHLAQQVYDNAGGQTHVIDRAYSSHEGNQWQFMSVDAYSNELMDGRQHIWKYVLNEPNAFGVNDVRRRNDWLADVTIKLTDSGYRVVVGNFAAGSWQSADIDAGAYDKLLQVISERNEVAKLGLHEYGAIVLPFNQDRWQAQHLADRNRVQPETWLYLDHDDPSLRLPDYRQDFIGHFYHLLRSHWLQHRCNTLGIRPVEIVMTEFGWDRMPDLAFGANNIYDVLKDHHGMPSPFQNIRGAYSHENVWRYYWNDWTISEAIYEQFKWCDVNYIPEWYVGFLPFMWSFGDNWDTIDGFNYGADKPLHNLMELWSTSTTDDTPQPEPNPEPEPMPTQIDMLDYIRGDGRLYELAYKFPGLGDGVQHVKTEPHQTRFFHVKGIVGHPAQWEELWYDNHFIWRGTDTSPNNDEIYQISRDKPLLQGGEYGAEWIPRFPELRDRFYIESYVTFRYKANGLPVPEKPAYLFPHWIELYAIYDSYQFASGITLNDVVELRGYLDNGVNFERYFYAKGFGLVGWQDPPKNWNSYISKLSVDGNLQRQTFDWLHLPPLDEIIDEETDPMTFPLSDPRWQPVIMSATSTRTNVRPDPTTQNDPVTSLSKERNALLLLDEARQMNDGVWYPIRLDNDLGATFETANWEISGWVRSDVVTYIEYEPPIVDDPDPPLNFTYIPLPELALTDEQSQDMAIVLRWFATIIENWNQVASGESDGIVLTSEDEP